MKALKYGISLSLVAGFVLTASCGGSTDGTSDSTAGASSGGATSAAGATATAGSNNASAGNQPTAGSTANGGATTNGGGANDAGASNDAGAPSSGGGTTSGGGNTSAGGASTGGAGGMTMNPAGCPATAPTADAMCTELASPQTRCNYTGQSCRCRVPNNGPGGGNAGAATDAVWQCTATLVCPATKPTVGADCTPAQGMCPYTGMGTCTCGQTAKWTCFGGGGTCPQAKPANGSACTGTSLCNYGNNSGCICSADKWVCN